MSPVRFVSDSTKYGAAEFRLVAQRMADVPDDVRRGLTRRLRVIGQRTVQVAAMKASWSSRIPASLRLRVSFKAKNPGLVISADADAAPHARPHEGLLSLTGTFRHPVFGNTDVWVSQPTRPFLWPSVLDTNDDVGRAADEAIDEALDRAVR